MGNAEVALEDDDSISPAVKHPPRIKFKWPDKTARYIMNVSTIFQCGNYHNFTTRICNSLMHI